MKESYTRQEVENMLKEAEQLLQEKYEQTTDKKEADNNFERLQGCEFTIGVLKACMDLYERGWKK